jgi:hypothetical protein
MIDRPLDLTRARSLSLAIVANQGSPVAGSIYLDDLRLVEPGFVAPLDVLRLINEINRGGTRRLDLPPVWQESPPPHFDVNGDNWLTPLDVLLVINHINARSAASGEGEAEAANRILDGALTILRAAEERVA